MTIIQFTLIFALMAANIGGFGETTKVEDKKITDLKISGTSTFLWRQFDDSFLERNPDSKGNQWEIYNRLTMNLQMDRIFVGLQFNLDRFEQSDGETSLEKRYVEIRTPRLKLTLGDFFASFGRGTVLSVVKTHELYGIENQTDNTIDGARVSYNDNRLNVEALSGYIRDPILNSEDQILGATAQYKALSWLKFGASSQKTELQAENQDINLTGLHVEFSPFDNDIIAAYEYTTLDSTSPFRNGADEGSAEYAELSAIYRNLSLTAEYKNLQNFFSKYSTPPFIEEQNQELLADFFAIYGEDLKTYKIRFDYTLPTDTLIYGVISNYKEKATKHPSYYRYDRDINHYYLGLEHYFENGIYFHLMAGSRDEESSGYYYQFKGPTTHGYAEVSLPLPGKLSLDAEYSFSKLDGDIVKFNRNMLAVTLARSQLFTITGVWESSNLPGEIFYTGKEDFYHCKVDVKIMRRHLIRVLFGETRGGIKCSGGVCKYVPAFKGVRTEAIIRF